MFKLMRTLGCSIVAAVAATSMAQACASMQQSHSGGGANKGAYYTLRNNCPYAVAFIFRAGVDGRGDRTREYRVFWPKGRTDTMFIYEPLPTRYNYEKR